MKAVMQYDYSTKNYHRFKAVLAGAVPNEVYIPRVNMPQPATEITVDVAVTNPTLVQERVKVKS